MTPLNLEALGVTEESFTNAILKQLGLTKKQAVEALAEKFGVELGSSDSKPAPISTGRTVVTDQGEAIAVVLTNAEAAALKSAAGISSRIFG